MRKQRKTNLSAELAKVPSEAFMMAFKTGTDHLSDLAPYGVSEAHLQAAWRIHGPAFLDANSDFPNPWALAEFGTP